MLRFSFYLDMAVTLAAPIPHARSTGAEAGGRLCALGDTTWRKAPEEMTSGHRTAVAAAPRYHSRMRYGFWRRKIIILKSGSLHSITTRDLLRLRSHFQQCPWKVATIHSLARPDTRRLLAHKLRIRPIMKSRQQADGRMKRQVSKAPHTMVEYIG